jgi:hypothetical protein
VPSYVFAVLGGKKIRLLVVISSCAALDIAQIVMYELLEDSRKAFGFSSCCCVSLGGHVSGIFLDFMCCCHNLIMDGHMFCVFFLSVNHVFR